MLARLENSRVDRTRDVASQTEQQESKNTHLHTALRKMSASHGGAVSPDPSYGRHSKPPGRASEAELEKIEQLIKELSRGALASRRSVFDFIGTAGLLPLRWCMRVRW